MITKTTFTIILLLSFGWVAQAQQMRVKEEKEISRSLSFENTDDPLLIIHNIEGNVNIEGYNGSTVEIEARQLLSAKSQSKLELAQEEVKLIIRGKGNIIMIYPETPETKVELNGRQLEYSINRRDEDYRFHCDFTVRVPQSISINASTINAGEVSVNNVLAREMKLHNINGPIRAKDVGGLSEASTVNGPIQVSYAQKPEEGAHFSTINGEINILLPNSMKADISFKSMNGDLFTDFEDVKVGPGIEKTSNKRGQKKTYRLDKSTVMQINGGGPLLDIEVLNGNVYVKKY